MGVVSKFPLAMRPPEIVSVFAIWVLMVKFVARVPETPKVRLLMEREVVPSNVIPLVVVSATMMEASAAGTPLGVQLVVVDQFALLPFQVDWAWAVIAKARDMVKVVMPGRDFRRSFIWIFKMRDSEAHPTPTWRGGDSWVCDMADAGRHIGK